jgi:hypothetical protein
MEQESVGILKGLLPKEWVVREYRPDYGIDLAVELFSNGGVDRIETLGGTHLLASEIKREIGIGGSSFKASIERRKVLAP